jgi:hypothetical protein
MMAIAVPCNVYSIAAFLLLNAKLQKSQMIALTEK